MPSDDSRPGGAEKNAQGGASEAATDRATHLPASISLTPPREDGQATEVSKDVPRMLQKAARAPVPQADPGSAMPHGQMTPGPAPAPRHARTGIRVRPTPSPRPRTRTARAPPSRPGRKRVPSLSPRGSALAASLLRPSAAGISKSRDPSSRSPRTAGPASLRRATPRSGARVGRPGIASARKATSERRPRGWSRASMPPVKGPGGCSRAESGAAGMRFLAPTAAWRARQEARLGADRRGERVVQQWRPKTTVPVAPHLRVGDRAGRGAHVVATSEEMEMERARREAEEVRKKTGVESEEGGGEGHCTAAV